MFLDILLIVIIMVCVLGIGFIVVRKFPRLKTLDVSTVPSAKRAEVMDRILIDRMRRSTHRGREMMKERSKTVSKSVLNVGKKLFRKVYELEKKYQEEAEGKIVLTGQELSNKIKGLNEDAKKLMKEEKFSEAEKIYIEVISSDPKNIEAYRGLVDIYLKLKEFKQALQTAEFVLRLGMKKSAMIMKEIEGKSVQSFSNANELADAYIDIGFIHESMGKADLAFTNYEKALELEPNSPRNLASMIDVCIELRKKEEAQKFLQRLAITNPENQGLNELQNRIDQI